MNTQTFPYTIIDLTHTLDETIPSWDGGCGFKLTPKLDYSDCTTDVKFRVHPPTLFSSHVRELRRDTGRLKNFLQKLIKRKYNYISYRITT